MYPPLPERCPWKSRSPPRPGEPRGNRSRSRPRNSSSVATRTASSVPIFRGSPGIHAACSNSGRCGSIPSRLRWRGGNGNQRPRPARPGGRRVFDNDLIQIGPMVLTLSIKPKADDPYHNLLTSAPVGWPFLEGIAYEPGPAPRPGGSRVPRSFSATHPGGPSTSDENRSLRHAPAKSSASSVRRLRL